MTQPTFEEAEPFKEELNGIEVGSIVIRRYDEDSVFIQNSDGEGMQVENSTLQDALIAFFEEHF